MTFMCCLFFQSGGGVIKRAQTLSRPLPPTPFQVPKEVSGSPQSKRMSGLQTLPGKIIRRATGIPGKIKSQQSIEELEPFDKKSAKRNPPSPFSSRKSHSPSPSRENLDVARGPLGSRQSSTASLDRISEDDRDTYEEVDDFLGGGSDESETRVQSEFVPAPVSAPVHTPIKEHAYEPIVIGTRFAPPITLGDSGYGYQDEERPFVSPKRSNLGAKKALTRSSSDSGTSGSSQSGSEDRERSPSLPTVQEEEKVTAEPPVPRKKSSRADIPPEPTSPPPSPPRDLFSPTIPPRQRHVRPAPPPPKPLPEPPYDPTVYGFDHLDKSPEPEQQPKLPPKQRKASRPAVDTHEVYAFDTLAEKEGKTAEEGIRDEVYFDHLFPGQEVEEQPTGGGGEGGGGEGVEGGKEVYFDHLFPGQEEEGKEQHQKPQPPGQPQAEGDVYFDHLFEGEQQPQQKNVRFATYPHSSHTHHFTHSPPHLPLLHPHHQHLSAFSFYSPLVLCSSLLSSLPPILTPSHPHSLPSSLSPLLTLSPPHPLPSSPSLPSLFTPSHPHSHPHSLSTFPLQPSATPHPYTPYTPQPERSQHSVSPDASGAPPPVPLKRSKTTKPVVRLSHETFLLCTSLSPPPFSFSLSSSLPLLSSLLPSSFPLRELLTIPQTL